MLLYQRHLLHIPPEQRKPEEKNIPKEFWEAASVADRLQQKFTPISKLDQHIEEPLPTKKQKLS